MMTDIQIFPNSDALAERATALFLGAAQEAIAARGRFTVALTGGSSPRETYARLAKASATQMDWTKAFVFMGDERFVPYDNDRSNFGMARRLLVGQVPVPPDQVFPMPTDTTTPEDAAEAYARTLSEVFGQPPDGPAPFFDLILLGLGDDGHCASLFPGMPTLEVSDRWVVSSPPGTLPPPVDRVTFTFPLLNAARQVVFLVTGFAKARPVADILEGGAGMDVHPAAGVTPVHGQLTWLLDKAAASSLMPQPAP